MKKLLIFLLITVTALCFMGLFAPVHAAGPDLQKGKWEITTKMEIPDMPAGMPQQTFVHTQCLTNDDYVPKSSRTQGAGGNCDIKNVRTDGDTVSWTMHCDTGQGEMNGEGSITYSGNTFEGTIKVDMQGGMKMIQHLKGRRIGACE